METSATGPPPVAAVAAGMALRAVRDQAMFLVDERGRIASWNEGVGLILQWQEEDWIGQPLSVVFTPEDVAAGVPEAEMRTASVAGRADDTRWMCRKDGERFFALGELSRLLDDAGRLVGYLKILRDDSHLQRSAEERERLAEAGRDLNRVETALHERDAELRALVDGVRDYAIYTVDPAGRIASWYPGAALLEGYSAEEAVGMPMSELFTLEDRAAGRPAREMAVAAAAGGYQGDGRRRRKDGSTFDAAVVLTSLRGPQGDVRGYLGLMHDITARKQLERERQATLADAQAARAEAERNSRSKDEFLSTISHELRTPLATIVSWAHVLERGAVGPETLQHGLAAISRNARMQVQLIEDLLDMNRIAAGELRIDAQPVQLGDVIAAAIDAALPSAAAKGVGLRSALEPQVGTVQGDETRLQRVVANLLSNAIKFTPAGGQISVALTRRGDDAQIAIADTGQGIEPEFLPSVFDRFRQQDATPTRRHGGLGIGLAIVEELVRLHGGAIHAQSLGPGHGSTFTVTLPVALPAAQDAAREQTPAAQDAARAPTSAGEDAVGAQAPAAQEGAAGAQTPVAQEDALGAQTPAARKAAGGPSTPAAEDADGAPTRAGAAAPQRPSRAGVGAVPPEAPLAGMTLLIVDDEPDVRSATRHVLKQAGARVVEADSAAAAMSLLRTERPTVILSDIGMPVIDGHEFMRRVRALPADEGGTTPAAAFTAYASGEDRQRALDAGYHMHLAKPVDSQDLVQSVQQLAGVAPKATR